ncbi:cytochrome-c peroxidase [Chitinophaga sp. 30R24]|uniref:cytochrome-c peroxidase n=1 Tax=Chitinophaga sp. 30R24 TaxID=3248838 RepID=UPI003B8FF0BA
MFQNKYIWLIWPLFTVVAVFTSWGFKQTTDNDIAVAHTITVFREGAAGFAAASRELETAIREMDATSPHSLHHVEDALKNCRLQYKRIEWFLDYFFFSAAMVYNRPAKTEIDEPYMEYQPPSGLQQMAVLLYSQDPYTQKKALLEQAEVISSSAADLPALLYQFTPTDKAIMESLRIELIRLYANGITGYDAPELKSGIVETAQSMRSIQSVLTPWLEQHLPIADTVSIYLKQCIQYLELHPDFDTFNRLEFLTSYALPLQENLGNLIRSLHLEQHTRGALNYEAKHLFSRNALNTAVFPDSLEQTDSLLALGQRLFSEKALSGNYTRSCATCHQPDKYFSDGLRNSVAFDGVHHVRRNAPSLYYTGLQYAQFWDGRAGSLRKQIQAVIQNPEEMNGVVTTIVTRLKEQPTYKEAFHRAFPSDSAISIQQVATAITAYVNSLSPMNSALDEYIAGNKNALTPAQIRGFNLFMGKAQCATCHFAPLFNGLTPPLYQFTEFENLGVPNNDNLEQLQPDKKDAGRFEFFPIDFYKGAFKTPTVRNAAMTAPYMHNGAFRDLEKVMAFYNAGGGNGLGLNDPFQTLSATKLNLSDGEIKDIIAFINALSDRPAPTYNY